MSRFVRLWLIARSLYTASPRSASPSAPQDTLTLRALVTTKDAGVIIGKGGKNVADIRDETGVKAGVSKVVPGVHERVLTVSGSVEGVAKVRNLIFIRQAYCTGRCLTYADSQLPGLHSHYLPINGVCIILPYHLLATVHAYLTPSSYLSQSHGQCHWTQWPEDQGDSRRL